MQVLVGRQVSRGGAVFVGKPTRPGSTFADSVVGNGYMRLPRNGSATAVVELTTSFDSNFVWDAEHKSNMNQKDRQGVHRCFSYVIDNCKICSKIGICQSDCKESVVILRFHTLYYSSFRRSEERLFILTSNELKHPSRSKSVPAPCSAGGNQIVTQNLRRPEEGGGHEKVVQCDSIHQGGLIQVQAGST